jgi:hypothetical protein
MAAGDSFLGKKQQAERATGFQNMTAHWFPVSPSKYA